MIKILRSNLEKLTCAIVFILLLCPQLRAQVTFETEVKVTDSVLCFDGVKVDLDHTQNSTTGYDYVYGNALTPLGDCVKTFKEYVFLTWYRGGKDDRHVMLTRYNTITKTKATIEFPHQHTGYNGKWWIGETHNTIAVGICPKDSTVHLLYDMHRNGSVAAFAGDCLRYSYSFDGAATVADEEFTLERFVNSDAGNYKHQAFDGITDQNTTDMLTYPAFFTNDEGDLFMKMRFGWDRNGKFVFAKFNGEKWNGYTDFNKMSAGSAGSDYNWGLYGDIKYVNGKLRIGFQQRSGDKQDKYLYQNGIYYASSDDASGLTQWSNYKGEAFSLPLVVADEIKVSEPGDWVATTQKDKVYIVSGFDWTVTDSEDIHFVSMVKDNEFNVTKKLHTYRKAGDTEFTTVEYDAGNSLYAAGNDVFVIGLKSGRVNIVKTEGGTSDFKEVYQQTTGPTFDKGVANVYDGKLYYYLKESGGSGDNRTTYLQVFDLDINTTPRDTSRYIEFVNLTDGQEIEIGTDLTVEANVGSAFKEVSLWSGDTNLGTLTSAPYQWSSHAILTDMTEASYTFKLVAKDSADQTIETSISLTTPDILSELTSLHISFEDEAIANWETDGADYGVVPAIVAGTNTRAGSKVMALSFPGNSSGHHVQNITDKIVVANSAYVHFIAYTATSDVAIGKTTPTLKIEDWTPTPPITAHAAVNVFERKVSSRPYVNGDSLNCYPRLRSKAQGGACIVYYDDLVMYTDQNATADLTSPEMGTNMSIAEKTDGVEINWTEGVDSLTGVNATLILRTSNVLAEAPVMKPQVAYATADDKSGISVVDDWTVIALLPNGTTTYTDNTTTANEAYIYAVVHKDVAYNYSAPLIKKEEPSKIDEMAASTFKCIGMECSIELSNLELNNTVSVYNVSGIKVLEQNTNANTLSVSVQQGIYIVKIAGDVKKVIVK